MADLSDVESALVAAIIAAGSTDASGCVTIGGTRVRAYRGTPGNSALTLDRASAVADICVFPQPGTTRDTTRWGVQRGLVSVASGISMQAAGQTATVSGTAIGGEMAGLLVNGQPFVYQAQLGDSAGQIAAMLTSLVRVTQICRLAGSTMTLPSARMVVARTAGIASVLQEWARQEQGFRISVWAPSPPVRDSVCSIVGSALSQISFLPLADGTTGRLLYRSTQSFDDDQAASVYRRELHYDVEYGTTAVFQAPTMLFGDLDNNTVPTYV